MLLQSQRGSVENGIAAPASTPGVDADIKALLNGDLPPPLKSQAGGPWGPNQGAYYILKMVD